MNSEVKKLWLDALRSGDYGKGVNALRSGENTYCCLGVLCDIYKEQTGKGQWKKDRTHYFDIGDNAYGLIPFEVRQWAELPYELSWALAGLNDGKYGKDTTFDNMANEIEVRV